MSVGMLVTEDDVPSFFTTNKEVRNYYGGLSKMIYYLFTEGAVKIDPHRLVEYLDEIYPASAIASTPIQGGKKRASRRRYNNKSKCKSKSRKLHINKKHNRK
jgi:hypothetical protein